MKQYEDAVVVVTAGASGIGRQLVLELAKTGATVIIADIDEAAGGTLAAESVSAGHAVSFAAVDVRDEAAVATFLETVTHKHGRLDYLFHGVGIVAAGEIRDIELDAWRQVIDTNITGTVLTAVPAYRLFARQGFGHLVVIASGAGLIPVPMMGPYSMSKFALVGLVDTMRIESRDLGFRVSMVCPGPVRTPGYERAILRHTDKDAVLQSFHLEPAFQDPDVTARRILSGVLKNKAIIYPMPVMRLSELSYHLTPAIYRWGAGRLVKSFRKRYRTSENSN